LVVGVVAALALPLVASSSALATTGYTLAGQFGSYGSGDGQFSFGPQGLAVLQSSGDVFGSDPYASSPRVQRFNASGTFISALSLPGTHGTPTALAIDSSGAGSVYISVTDPNTFNVAIVKYSLAGTFAYALNVPSGFAIPSGARIAVDPVNGTVFVAATDAGVPVVATFDGGTGAFVSSFDGSNGSPDGVFGCVSGLAVDAAHRLYVVDNCDGRVYRYAADGSFVAVVDDGSRGAPTHVAVDPVSGEVFVAEAGPNGTIITPFSAGGVSAGTSFGQGSISVMGGLAVGHDSATVYVSSALEGAVKRFVKFEGPTVTTTTNASVDATSQTVNGTIDPEGGPATYHFDYGTSTAYGSSTAESEPLTGTDPLPATATATGLSPNTTYHFRIVGSNASGSIPGEDQTFTTATAPPVLDGSPAFASAITPTGVTLNATLNPRGSATTYHFEYGTTTGYGSSSDSAVSSAGAADEPVSVPVTGLVAGTTYHYRLVADNGTGGVQHGADGVFHTAPATPVSATNVTVYGASLHGVVNPHGAATTYHFDYGTSPTAYDHSTPEADAGSGDGEQAVTAATGALTPDTTYHLRLVATSNGQTTSSEDRTFTTGALPLTVAKDATGVSLNAATVNGTIDTHGKDGTYQFTVEALDRSYVKDTEPQQVSSTEPKAVSATLSDLPDGTTFRVTLSITSNGTTKTSDQVVFATPARPLAPPRAPFADQGSPYGCTAPVLNAYDARPKPGETITITGKDLGTGGTIALGATTTTSSWSSTGLTVDVPEDARGTLALTVNCGQVSNTIAVAVYEEPSNAFSITKTTVKGPTATLSLKLPGVGKVQTSARHTKNTTTTITNAGTVKVKVKLSTAGTKALKKAKGRKLNVAVRIRYTPAGGTTATETVTVTYTRKAGR
jgi:hypothetical protein